MWQNILHGIISKLIIKICDNVISLKKCYIQWLCLKKITIGKLAVLFCCLSVLCGFTPYYVLYFKIHWTDMNECLMIPQCLKPIYCSLN